jgi:hypothetical protein
MAPLTLVSVADQYEERALLRAYGNENQLGAKRLRWPSLSLPGPSNDAIQCQCELFYLRCPY